MRSPKLVSRGRRGSKYTMEEISGEKRGKGYNNNNDENAPC